MKKLLLLFLSLLSVGNVLYGMGPVEMQCQSANNAHLTNHASEMKKTAKANANIALIKYWGKKIANLNIPQNNSISVTLSELETITTVEFHTKYTKDILIINGNMQDKIETQRVSQHLNLIREMANITQKAKVVSVNNFPTSTGLASSSSAFAALSLAATQAAGITLNSHDLSILARKGSGSACRSIHSGFVEWIGGNTDSESFSKQLLTPDKWPDFRIVVVITSNEAKDIKSTMGMDQTVATSPMYKTWLETIKQDIEIMRRAIEIKDFTLLGETAERNCLKMHATMLTTVPPLIYWNDITVNIIKSIIKWRNQGLECYFTIDAGAQVKILCEQENIEKLKLKLSELRGIQDIIICNPGPAPKIIDNHLF